ncbi:outer spore coat protein CotE [Staphylospora marina]|uniref:outer spore coat protein CotE n=1 Tax=Staphylospora marina TaxID=2490858 RepID=UPI000F5BA4CA|nr:outer spore coat protein CotE [Staphylospora marina]
MLSYADRAVEYRQIITRAVCGKGRKFSQTTHTIKPAEDIHTILGAWVINHRYECGKIGEAVEVRGSYDVNIWYATKGNTKTDVVKETVHYTEQIPLHYYDRNTRESSVLVSAAVTQAPNCVEASIASKDDGVLVRVEKEFVVEMVGETKICVPVYPLEYAENDDKELISEYSDEYGSESFDELDPNLEIDDLED